LAIAFDRDVVVWDLAAGKETRRWQGHRSAVISLAFSSDGRRLASGSDDSTALIWDLAGQGPARTVSLAPVGLEKLWADLAAADPGRVTSAQQMLATGAAEAIPFLQARLAAAVGGEARLPQLLADLDHDDFKVREQATAALAGLGPHAVPALHKVLAGAPSAEARRRIQQLLARQLLSLPPPHPPPARAIAVLERIATPTARQALAQLAQGEPAAAVTQAARAALKRIGD